MTTKKRAADPTKSTTRDDGSRPRPDQDNPSVPAAQNRDERVEPEPSVATLMQIYEELHLEDTRPAPEFGSRAWLALPKGHPLRELAKNRATAGYFNRRWAEEQQAAERLAQASHCIAAAAEKLWRRVASDRAARLPQQRERSVYPAPRTEATRWPSA